MKYSSSKSHFFTLKKVAIMLLIINFSHAQNEVISIWKNKIPGEIKDVTYQENNVLKDSIIQRTSKISEPSIMIFQPQNPNGTAILIFPGGGYEHLSTDKEGVKIAQWLNTLQITAFVIKYRLPSDLIMKDKTVGPLQDAQEALRIVRRNAQKWSLDSTKIGVIGFSAGGHLAATLSTKYDDKTYLSIDSTSAKPNFELLIYPVISMKEGITHSGSKNNLLGKKPSKYLINKFSAELHVSDKTSPTFLVHASDDKSVSFENSIKFFEALRKNNVESELHIYEKGGHGFGLGTKDTSLFWTLDCINWLKNHNYL